MGLSKDIEIVGVGKAELAIDHKSREVRFRSFGHSWEEARHAALYLRTEGFLGDEDPPFVIHPPDDLFPSGSPD